MYNSHFIVGALGIFLGILEIFPKRLFFSNSFDIMTCYSCYHQQD